MPDDFPLAARGVYAESFTRGGMRGYFAVDSRGEQVAYRLLPKDRPTKAVIAELWAELNELDPIAPHLHVPDLRLVR